jgi:hypothetical protein
MAVVPKNRRRLREFADQCAGYVPSTFIRSIESDNNVADESGFAEFVEDFSQCGGLEVAGVTWQDEREGLAKSVEFLLELFKIGIAEAVKRGNSSVLIEVRHVAD